MHPIKFHGQNIVFGETQPEYQDLPALCLHGPQAEVITCWKFSDMELEAMVRNKCFYMSQLRFGSYNEDGVFCPNALQPILPMAELGDNLKLEL